MPHGELVVHIRVDTSELDEAIAKAKELLDLTAKLDAETEVEWPWSHERLESD